MVVHARRHARHRPHGSGPQLLAETHVGVLVLHAPTVPTVPTSTGLALQRRRRRGSLALHFFISCLALARVCCSLALARRERQQRVKARRRIQPRNRNINIKPRDIVIVIDPRYPAFPFAQLHVNRKLFPESQAARCHRRLRHEVDCALTTAAETGGSPRRTDPRLVLLLMLMHLARHARPCPCARRHWHWHC